MTAHSHFACRHSWSVIKKVATSLHFPIIARDELFGSTACRSGQNNYLIGCASTVFPEKHFVLRRLADES